MEKLFAFLGKSESGSNILIRDTVDYLLSLWHHSDFNKSMFLW